jgi:hypothetical protein
MLDIRTSELMLLLRDGHATRDSAFAPFCEPQPPQPVSPAERHWDHPFRPDAYAGEPFPLNAQLAWQFHGALDHECLERAAREVTRRHSILRCTLDSSHTERRFIADAAPELQLRRFVARDQRHIGRMPEVSEFAWRPFELGAEGPLRLASIDISGDEHVIALALHHSFTDFYSTRILSHEITALYDAFRNGQSSPFPEPPLQFFDYLISIKKWCTSPRSRQHGTYWQEYMQGARGIEPTRGEVLAVRTCKQSMPVSEAIRSLCKSERVGLHMFWELAQHVALWRLLGTPDIATASIDVGRRQRELVGLIGRYINLLPNRSRIDADRSFRQLLREMSAARRSTTPYCSAPYHFIADRSPFDYASGVGALNYIPAELLPEEGFGASFGRIRAPRPPAAWFQFPYVLMVLDGPETSVVGFGEIVKPFSVTELVDTLGHIVNAVTTAPDRSIASLS